MAVSGQQEDAGRCVRVHYVQTVRTPRQARQEDAASFVPVHYDQTVRMPQTKEDAARNIGTL